MQSGGNKHITGHCKSKGAIFIFLAVISQMLYRFRDSFSRRLSSKFFNKTVTKDTTHRILYLLLDYWYIVKYLAIFASHNHNGLFSATL